MPFINCKILVHIIQRICDEIQLRVCLCIMFYRHYNDLPSVKCNDVKYTHSFTHVDSRILVSILLIYVNKSLYNRLFLSEIIITYKLLA